MQVYKPSHMILGEGFDKMSLTVSQEIAVLKVIFNNVTIYRLNLVSIWVSNRHSMISIVEAKALNIFQTIRSEHKILMYRPPAGEGKRERDEGLEHVCSEIWDLSSSASIFCLNMYKFLSKNELNWQGTNISLNSDSVQICYK